MQRTGGVVRRPAKGTMATPSMGCVWWLGQGTCMVGTGMKGTFCTRGTHTPGTKGLHLAQRAHARLVQAARGHLVRRAHTWLVLARRAPSNE